MGKSFQVYNTFSKVNFEKNSNERYTKPYAVYPILKYLDKNKIYWLPCDTDESYFTKIMKQEGFKIINTNIDTGHDFYQYEPLNYDCIITNPPFTNKSLFVKRCLHLKKPFALILPLHILEDTTIFKIFKDIELQFLFFDKRMEFLNNKSNSNKISFKCIYFCYKILPRQVIFDNLHEKTLF